MVLFVTFLQISRGGKIDLIEFANIPITVISGAIIGFLVGKFFIKITAKIRSKNTTKFLLFLSLSFLRD